MSMSAVGPFFPQALTTDNRTSERVLVQWRDGTGGRDYFEALSRIVYVNEFTETHSSSGLPGEPYQYRAHTHFEIVSLLLRMEGPDGFLTEILVDGTPAPRIDSTQGCDPGNCFLEIHEAAFDRYTVYDRDASGRVLANYRYYTNYIERRSQALPTAASSSVTEAPVDPVEVGEPATFGIAAFGVVCVFWARLRVRQRPDNG
jgi:hypothetical protein